MIPEGIRSTDCLWLLKGLKLPIHKKIWNHGRHIYFEVWNSAIKMDHVLIRDFTHSSSSICTTNQWKRDLFCSFYGHILILMSGHFFMIFCNPYFLRFFLVIGRELQIYALESSLCICSRGHIQIEMYYTWFVLYKIQGCADCIIQFLSTFMQISCILAFFS